MRGLVASERSALADLNAAYVSNVNGEADDSAIPDFEALVSAGRATRSEMAIDGGRVISFRITALGRLALRCCW